MNNNIACQATIKECNRKPNEISVNKCSNTSMKLWLKLIIFKFIQLVMMYLKSVAAERFTRALTNKIYKYMTSLSKKCSINFPKYWNNITIHTSIKLKPIAVKISKYINFLNVWNLKIEIYGWW